MEQIKKYKVLENYERHIFSNNKQLNWDRYSNVDITICDESVYHWFKNGDSWNNAEFYFDTIEQVNTFIDKQIAKVEYIEINQEFEAYYYMIFQYNEDTEEYDIDGFVDNCNYWSKEYKPCYSSKQVKDELYYHIENLNNKQLIELNNFIYENQTEKTMHHCIDKLLEYGEDTPIDGDNISFEDMADFMFWNDELDYNEEIKNILKLYNLK